MLITVQPHLRFGGAERQSVLLANELQRRGRVPGVIVHEAVGGLVNELQPKARLEVLGVDNHLLTPLVARRLRTTLEQRFADSRSLVVPHLWASLLAASLADGGAGEAFTFAYYEDSDPSDHAEYIRFGRLKQRLIGRVFRRAGIVVANSHRVADTMTRVYGLDRRPHVITPAVDLEDLDLSAVKRRGQAPPQSSRLRIATVGSLIPRKGLPLVYRGLVESGIECDWHVIGEGPLRAWLDSLPTSGRVRVFPRGGHPRPFELVREMDLVVHGAHSESFGVVLLEAIGVGTPVLAAAAAGPTEMVATLGSAPEILSLFPAGDADALAGALRARVASLDRTPSRQQMQEYLRPYSIEKAADAWTALAEDAGCEV